MPGIDVCIITQLSYLFIAFVDVTDAVEAVLYAHEALYNLYIITAASPVYILCIYIYFAKSLHASGLVPELKNNRLPQVTLVT